MHSAINSLALSDLYEKYAHTLGASLLSNIFTCVWITFTGTDFNYEIPVN